MKWFGVATVVLAVAIKFLWHPPMDLSFRVSAGLHRGYSISTILFWILLIVGAVLIYFGFRKHAT